MSPFKFFGTIRTFPNDDYHPHFPDRQQDYTARLMQAAPLMADRWRLMCHKYEELTAGNSLKE